MRRPIWNFSWDHDLLLTLELHLSTWKYLPTYFFTSFCRRVFEIYIYTLLHLDHSQQTSAIPNLELYYNWLKGQYFNCKGFRAHRHTKVRLWPSDGQNWSDFHTNSLFTYDFNQIRNKVDNTPFLAPRIWRISSRIVWESISFELRSVI